MTQVVNWKIFQQSPTLYCPNLAGRASCTDGDGSLSRRDESGQCASNRLMDLHPIIPVSNVKMKCY